MRPEAAHRQYDDAIARRAVRIGSKLQRGCRDGWKLPLVQPDDPVRREASVRRSGGGKRRISEVKDNRATSV